MNDKELTILYGSQTGTAQDVAERLWRNAKCYGFHGPALAMDDYQISNLINESMVVFVCSTTGQGDQPDNMKKFWKFLLRKSLPSNSLQSVRFAVLGLGDSSYVRFNFCAKKLYRRLLQLGGTPVIEPGYADDQHDLGVDAVVDPWIAKLWQTLVQSSPGTSISKMKLFPARWAVNTMKGQEPSDDHLIFSDLLKDNSAQVTCLENERVTSLTHFQDTRLIKFTLENLHYVPGDVLMIKPKNSAQAVDQFFNLFFDRRDEIYRNLVVTITEQYPDMPVPHALQKPVTLNLIVENYWDLNMVPRRYTFELLSHFTDSELERDKLIEFTTAEGQEELYSYCNRPKRTILEVLADFPHATAKIPFQYLFELFQPIRTRAFSIASSPKAHPGQLHILVAVVKYKTNLKLPRIGLCSNWLASLAVQEKVIVYLRRGSMIFPSKKNIPAIMVGPGTGIAPFRSFVHEESSCNDSCKNYVFFGCRSKSADFYFENEWSLLEQKEKVEVFVAFSRDQTEKIYVQHVIEANEKIVSELLVDRNAHVFVAGNSKNMPDAVRKILESCYAKYAGITQSEAANLFEKMDLNGRYQTETWS